MRSLQILNNMKNVAKKNDDDCLQKSNLCEPSPKRHWSSNVQLTEFRTEEHHEERAGTNTL